VDEGAGAEILRALARVHAPDAMIGEVRCVAWVPLRSRYTSGIDALALGSTRPRPGLAQGTALAAEQLPFLDLLASQIDAAIENAALRRRLAEQDARIEQRVLARTEELRQANTALAATAKRKDELLAWMAHELRTPLNAVVGYCE
jgi:signal transduction histidine kinase